MAGVDDVDGLYDLDPAEFTAARNALAKQLRAAGNKEEAKEVAALRKPNAPAWALNQVARRSPDLVEAALAAGAGLRLATEAAVGGDPSGLRDAAAADRSATSALVAEASALLPSGGQAVQGRLADTVRAAVLDETVADLLCRGVLASDHAQPGLGFGGDPTTTGLATVTDLGQARSSRRRKEEAKAKAAQAGEDERDVDGEGDGGGDGDGVKELRPSAAERRKAESERRKAEAEAERVRRRHQAEMEDVARKAERRAERLTAAAERAEDEAAALRAEADHAGREAEQARSAADHDADE